MGLFENIIFWIVLVLLEIAAAAVIGYFVIRSLSEQLRRDQQLKAETILAEAR